MERYCHMGELQQLAATNRYMGKVVRDYVKGRITRVGAQYFSCGNDLFDMLHSCDAVISGSTALHVLLPECGTLWTPTDLDIYVLHREAERLLDHLTDQGYAIIAELPVKKVGYTYSHVSRLVVLTNGKNSVDVVVSKTSTTLSPIFQFHSTAVMNFISADTIFSGYPTLTLWHLSVVNAGPLYYHPQRHAMICAICKYIKWGIRYICCEQQHGLTNTCKVTMRTVTDHATMWFNFQARSHTSHSFQEVFRGFGVLDLQWMLGGMLCSLECAFARPRVDVVEDQSYLLWDHIFSPGVQAGV
ncbi:hypothetical protein BKA83DRAFT_4132226 [Pisolithus microcarpus]|nr:hypothetical protein BKA83DRAFT_4132226 [Pisolithus microcarpus]